MTPQELKKISLDKEYSDIKSQLDSAAKDGHFDILCKRLAQETQDRLTKEGFKTSFSGHKTEHMIMRVSFS